MLQGDAGPLPNLFTKLAEFFNRHIKPQAKSNEVSTPLNVLDIGIAPFVGRVIVLAKHGVLGGALGKNLYEEKFLKQAEFERVRTWWTSLEQKDSWRNTFDEVKIVEEHLKKFAKAN